MTLQALRLIIYALMSAVAIFTVVAALLGPLADAESPPSPALFFAIAGVLAVGAFVAWSLVQKPLLAPLARDVEGARETLRGGGVPGALGNAAIVAGSLCEGVGLIGAAGLLVTGYLPLLAVPIAALGAMTQVLPTRERLEAQLERARRAA